MKYIAVACIARSNGVSGRVVWSMEDKEITIFEAESYIKERWGKLVSVLSVSCVPADGNPYYV